MTTILSNGILTATIAELGAELLSLKDAQGRELMTDANPAYWTGHAPILFPIVGRLHGDRYRLGDTSYVMPQHGFARRRTFAKVAQNEGVSATFALADDAETLSMYPFAFVLHVEHSLEGATLKTLVSVTNSGTHDLPASIGFHPAFAWPLPYGGAREAHRMVFSDAERDTIAEITADGTIAATPRPSPLEGQVLHLGDALFTDDALVWDPVSSTGVSYGTEDGSQLRVDFPGMPRLGIWTKPGANFVCIEPWDGIADPEGFDGDIFDKPGIRRVAPGETHAVAMAVTLVD
ncbi:aldose 1-epimerase family protein [Sphingomonas sp. Leaf25]|uniref:aldose 1-epimerase family protein n=1 Tax=Sphingomonas sp. Leaf25 TaxID=1735692 RepID=UPI0006F632DE|nr:aldose 1-epimerase family protein [Sphingomonas sp. Leaf25]KQN05341.1 aldose epimerase [Sphingomonas sp. Leaf25]